MELPNNTETDFLTKCLTRNNLAPFLERLLIESSIEAKPISIAMIDLDGFKSINDKHGHTFGDEALKYFSSSLRLSIDDDYLNTMSQKFIFRYGGDEFVIVFPGKTAQEAQRTVAGILRTIRRRHFLFKGRQFQMSFSTGIATYPHDAPTVAELLERADKALYFSKKRGKSKITQFGGIATHGARQLLKVLLIVAIIAFLTPLLTLRVNIAKIFTSGTKAPIFSQRKIDRIYLKSGGVIRGVITKDSDPLEVKMIMDKGEGLILLRKSEILKIEPDN